MKEIKILLAIIAILVVILLIKVFVGDNTSKMTEMEYDRNFIIGLLERGQNYNNYSCEYTHLDGKNYIRKYKDNLFVISTDEMTIYQNNDTNKQIIISEKRNTALISGVDSSKVVSMDNYCKSFLDLIKKDSVDYKYLKQESYNDLECIVIQLKWLNEKGNGFTFGDEGDIDELDSTMELWISKKSGLIAKCYINSVANTNETISKEVDYHLKLDVVTDDEVKEPDLQGYNTVNV